MSSRVPPVARLGLTVPVDALLIIDVQNYFIKNHKNLIPKIAELAQSFPAERTWWYKFRNVPGSAFEKRLFWSDMMVAPETDIEPSLQSLAKNVIEHESYLPNDQDIEVVKDCKYVALVGLDTDACVMAMALLLWQHNIYPIVLADYCNSSGGDNFHRPALDIMRRSFGADAIVSGITPSAFALEQVRRKTMQAPSPG